MTGYGDPAKTVGYPTAVFRITAAGAGRLGERFQLSLADERPDESPERSRMGGGIHLA